MAADTPAANPVAAILDAVDPAAAPAAPGRPVKTSGLSMTPEAVRMRARRAKARNENVAGSKPVEEFRSERSTDDVTAAARDTSASPQHSGEKFTASHLQLLPDGPARPAVSLDQVEKATAEWTRIFKMAGTFAAKIFKGDELKLSDRDARDCAESLLDGWPELALQTDADWKKIMAGVTIASVANERWDAHKAARGRPASVPASTGPELVREPPTATGQPGKLPMQPVSM